MGGGYAPPKKSNHNMCKYLCVIFFSSSLLIYRCNVETNTHQIKKNELIVSFPIEEEYVLITNFINDSLLAFYCKNNKTIRIYDRCSGKVVSERTLQKQGEDIALISVDSILILDNSEFYLNSKYHFVLHFLNTKNNRHDSIILSNLHVNNTKFIPDAILNEMDIEIKNKDILIPCFADFNPEADSSMYEKWFTQSPDLKVSIKNGKMKIKPFGKYPKEIAKYTNIFYPYRLTNDKYTIYSHPYSSYIVAIDNQDDESTMLALKSEYVTDFANIPFNKLGDKYFIQSFYIENPMYYKVLYNTYRDEYYRLIYYKYDLKGNSTGNFKNKSWGIIRFRIENKKAVILDEKQFDGRVYDASQAIITPKGLLLQRREKSIHHDTIQLSYDLLQF